MIIFFSGDLYGHILDFYNSVSELEKAIGTPADWILQTGNFGIYPDPARASGHIKRNNGHKSFSKLYLNDTSVPRPTLFVTGKYEDHRWLRYRRDAAQMQILPNLHFLVNGYKTFIGDENEKLSVVGLGKTYSSAAYRKGENGEATSHYTRAEVDRACVQGQVDLLLTHEAPAGAKLGVYQSEAEGINKICFATRPKLLVHGHYNSSREYMTPQTKIPALSLATQEIAAYEYQNGLFQRIV